MICNFCYKNQEEVDILIVGRSVNICYDCINQCIKMIKNSNDNMNSPGINEASKMAIEKLETMTDAELIAYINKPFENQKSEEWYSGKITSKDLVLSELIQLENKVDKLRQNMGDTLDKLCIPCNTEPTQVCKDPIEKDMAPYFSDLLLSIRCIYSDIEAMESILHRLDV